MLEFFSYIATIFRFIFSVEGFSFILIILIVVLSLFIFILIVIMKIESIIIKKQIVASYKNNIDEMIELITIEYEKILIMMMKTYDFINELSPSFTIDNNQVIMIEFRKTIKEIYTNNKLKSSLLEQNRNMHKNILKYENILKRHLK